MQRPNILTIQDYHFLNLLCGYTSRENLSAWYRDFQTIGRLAVQWIRTVQRQTLQLGLGTGWNWEGRQGLHLEYPERRLITNGDCGSESSDSVLEDSSIWSDNDFSGSSEFTGDSGDEEKHMILHPVQSTYATRNPDFNLFEKRLLIDNGYVDDTNNQCQALIVHPTVGSNQEALPVNYANTLFTVKTMEE